jgi:hypothetical protein
MTLNEKDLNNTNVIVSDEIRGYIITYTDIINFKERLRINRVRMAESLLDHRIVDLYIKIVGDTIEPHVEEIKLNVYGILERNRKTYYDIIIK